MAKSVQIASVFTAIGFKVNKKDLDRLQKQLINLKNQIKGLQRHTKLNIDPNVKGLTAAKTQLTGINRELAKIKNKAIRVRVDSGGLSNRKSVNNIAHGTGRGAFAGSLIGSEGARAGVATAGILGVGLAGASILKTGQQLQAVRAALIAASGGVQQGKDEFKFMTDLSQQLGINFQDNVRSYTNFLASAKAVTFSLSDTRSVFAATAASARVLGLSSADTNGIMRAMTQILSKGTVQAEELRGQLGERLPGAVGLMSKALGVSVTELNKMLEQGQVISKDALPKLRDQMLKFATANGALQKAVNSNLANQERLANAWFFFKAHIAESGFMDVMTESFVRFMQILNGNEGAANSVGAAFVGLAKVFKAIFSVVGDLLTAVGSMPVAIQAILGFITFLLLPFATWAIAIVAVIALLEQLFAFMRGEENVLDPLIARLKEMETTLIGIGVALAVISGAAAFKLFAKLKTLKVPIAGTSGTVGAAAKTSSTLLKGAGAVAAPLTLGLVTFDLFIELKKQVTQLTNIFSEAGRLQNLQNQLAQAKAQEKARQDGFLTQFLGNPFGDSTSSNESEVERLQREIKIHVTADPGLTPTVIN
tara:strand:- start:7679 stop:9460 length:1782 start_codon:yes stop_codon:yes gene_type:complete